MAISMNENAGELDAPTMKIGLLMESAQSHQRLAETQLERLRAHTEELDDVVRASIRSALITEFGALTAECERTVTALRKMKQAVQVRGLAWNVALALACTALPSAIAYYVLPTQSDIDGLRKARDGLMHQITELERRGGKADWRSCGSDHLCVRVEKNAPVYGDQADYYIVKGY